MQADFPQHIHCSLRHMCATHFKGAGWQSGEPSMPSREESSKRVATIGMAFRQSWAVVGIGIRKETGVNAHDTIPRLPQKTPNDIL